MEQAIKEAKYRELTTPRPPYSIVQQGSCPTSVRATSGPHPKLRRAAKIASRAADDGQDDSSSLSSSASDENSRAHKDARPRKRWEEKQEQIKSAKMMDLQYFLEMIDVKHRYGMRITIFMPAHTHFTNA